MSVSTTKKWAEKATEYNDPTAELPDIEFIPLPQLDDDVKPGEEDQEILFHQIGTLFIYTPKTKKKTMRGAGSVKILFDPKTDVHRVVVRPYKGFTDLANFRLEKNMRIVENPYFGCGAILHVVDFSSDTKGTKVVWCIRFRETRLYNAFKAKVNEICGTTELVQNGYSRPF